MNTSIPNSTTYTRAYQNYNPRSYSSFDERPANKKNDSFNGNEQNQQDNNDDSIETIQLDDDRQRSGSASLTKTKKQSKKPQSPVGRPPSSHKQKHRVESIQFNDDNDNHSLINTNDNEDEYNQQPKNTSSSSNRAKPSSKQNDDNNNNRTRKIRELQNKLSRQEEESKKKFDELLTKQSRLENAIKLLVKQTSHKKRRQQTNDQVEGKSNFSFVHLFLFFIKIKI